MAKRAARKKTPGVADHLARAEQSGLIGVAQLEPEIEYLFRHALVQDAAYWSLLKDQRRGIHRAIGQALETLYPDRLVELAPLLAKHFDQGGEPAAALRHYLVAGDAASARYANSEAIMAYGRALELARTLDAGRDQLLHLYTGKGRAEELSGRHDDALATYEAMEQTAHAIGDRLLELESLNCRATVYSTFTTRADPAQGMALSERALALAREIGDEPAQARILWNLLLVNTALGRNAEAIRQGEESLAIARRLGLTEQTAYALHDLSSVLTNDGQAERAAALSAEARGLWRELGNQAMLADSLIAGATAQMVRGAYLEGRAMLEEGLEISTTIGNAWGQSYAHMGLGYFNLAMLNPAESMAQCRESVRLAEMAGFGFAQVYARCLEALILSYLGQAERASALLEVTRRLTANDQTLVAVMPTLFGLSISRDQGDLAGLERLIGEAARQSWDDPTPAMMVSIAQAELALAQGRPLDAIRHSDALLGQPPPVEANLFLFEGRAARGRAQLAVGDAAAARETLEELVEEYEQTGARFYKWEALAALSEVAEAQSDTSAATAARARARAELERLIGAIGDPALEASFRARKDVAALLGG